MKPIFELTMHPVAFAPCAWMNGWERENSCAVQHDPLEKSVAQYARIANGDTRGLNFWNADGQAHALNDHKGAALAMLDNEVCGDRLYDMCRLFKTVSPGLKLTTYGFFGPWTGYATLDHIADHDGFAKLCEANQDAVDYIDINSYMSVDSTKGPEDWDRSIDVSLHRMDRMIDLARQYASKPLNAVIWPRMLFSNPVANLPAKWVTPYIQLAARCEILSVFDLKASDTGFIAGLRAA